MNAEQLLDGVIQQFAHRAACLRELVQNAIDADTDRIDVWFDEQDGYYRVAVEDYGCGMTVEDIDNYLLNVFKSSKEGDLEYIGRFGIGFVSVFALKPEFVTVETSKDDHHTRIVIDSNLGIRYFDGEPRVGTRVSLYLRFERRRAFDELAREGTAFLRASCRYIDVELVVNHFDEEEVLNAPFELDLPMVAHYEQDGTRILVGYGETPRYTLMNRRLVLEEGRRALVPGAVVLASSRDIEHNLARNAVIQDEHFARFMERLRALAVDELLPQLRERLRDRTGGAATVRALAAIAAEPPDSLPRAYRAVLDEPIFPFVDPDGDEPRWRGLNSVIHRSGAGRLPIVTRENSAFARRLAAHEPVLLATESWPVDAVLLAAIGASGGSTDPLPSLEDCGGVIPRERPALAPILARVGEASGLTAAVGELAGRGAEALAVRVSEPDAWWQHAAPGGPVLMLSATHPLVRHAERVAERHPGLAVQLLLRALEDADLAPTGAADAALGGWLGGAND